MVISYCFKIIQRASYVFLGCTKEITNTGRKKRKDNDISHTHASDVAFMIVKFFSKQSKNGNSKHSQLRGLWILKNKEKKFP